MIKSRQEGKSKVHRGKKTAISSADEHTSKSGDAELNEEELKGVSGGTHHVGWDANQNRLEGPNSGSSGTGGTVHGGWDIKQNRKI